MKMVITVKHLMDDEPLIYIKGGRYVVSWYWPDNPKSLNVNHAKRVAKSNMKDILWAKKQ